jgi:alkanesulfonate monooxygenase SsuD/methylene tetrahydromethanopterin reductase-like flavin-dependent oxidoreductase (luciferase family)
MQMGVVFPQTEIGGDVGAVRAYVHGVEELGYRHVLAYDHVLGADPAVHAPWSGPYDIDTTFHEPFVLFGYIAGATSLEVVTGVIVLPQRQTALVAKQAAEVDLLTGGRSGSVSAWGGTASSTRRSACPSRRGRGASASRWRCCAGSGRSGA